MAIGLKNLPSHILSSQVFSKEDLINLASVAASPTSDNLKMIKASPDVKRILDEFDNPSQCREALHGLAQQYLLMDEIDRAAAIAFL